MIRGAAYVCLGGAEEAVWWTHLLGGFVQTVFYCDDILQEVGEEQLHYSTPCGSQLG